MRRCRDAFPKYVAQVEQVRRDPRLFTSTCRLAWIRRSWHSRSVPRVLILSGPNGAGKTTFAREFLVGEAHCPAFINADLIAAGLSPFEPERVALRAGKLMLQMIAEHVERGSDFAFETTLAGRNYARSIPRWRAAGYYVTLIFLSLPTAELAIDRVAQRVRQGGHAVAEDVIRRRFESGRENFENLYKPLVDAWAHYDNASHAPILVASHGEP